MDGKQRTKTDTIKRTRTMRTQTMIYNRHRNVDNEWCRWLRQLFHDDCFGMWFPFTLATRYTPEQLEHRIASLCLGFTKFVFRRRPDLTLNHRKRHGYCAFVLAATSYSGVPHFHGLFRTPSSDPSIWVSGTIQQNGQPLTIQMPIVLMEMLKLYPRDAIDASDAPSVLGESTHSQRRPPSHRHAPRLTGCQSRAEVLDEA